MIMEQNGGERGVKKMRVRVEMLKRARCKNDVRTNH